LLRRGIHRRIGAGEPLTGHMVRLWIAALAAGGAAVAADLLFARDLAARLPFSTIAEAVMVCGVFGFIYFIGAIALGVPEARATIGRFICR
ncbi:MAG: hypothetical protein WA208_10055, partial [Thermoanaerobaculia bacterium]